MFGLKIVFENEKGNIYNKNKVIMVAHEKRNYINWPSVH